MKKITKIIREQYDTEGLLEKEEKVIEINYPSEPNFIKFYVDNLNDLFKLNNTSKNILICLLELTNYDNIVDLPNGKRKQIMEKLLISYAQLDNGLRDLIKNNIINKQALGVYFINPNYFGKGSWKDIYEIRQETIISNEGCFNITQIKSINNKKSK